MTQYFNYQYGSSIENKLPLWANSNNYGYYFQSSIEKYSDIVSVYGEPDSLVNKYGGLAIWLNKDFYKRIELYDIISINTFPIPQNDIICLIIHIKISKDMWEKISIMCSNLSYDFLNNDIYIRCPTINYGNALLSIVILILNGTISSRKLNNYPIIKTAINSNRLQNPVYQNMDLKIIKNFISLHN